MKITADTETVFSRSRMETRETALNSSKTILKIHLLIRAALMHINGMQLCLSGNLQQNYVEVLIKLCDMHAQLAVRS